MISQVVSKPKESTAKALKKLFPCKSGSTPRFDPRSECASTSARNKKKKFVPKFCSIETVMLKKFQTRIPKGDYRQELVEEGRIKKISLNQQITPSDVKRKILSEFKCDDFVMLQCNRGYLTRLDDEQLTATAAIARRGALYLCQKQPVSTIVLEMIAGIKHCYFWSFGENAIFNKRHMKLYKNAIIEPLAFFALSRSYI